MNLKNIYRTEFHKNVIESSSEIINKSVTKEGKKENIKLENHEEYSLSVFHSMAEVYTLLDNLYYCEIFFNSYTTSATWKNNYDKNHYYRYHFESWITNIVRLFDRFLILINDVYDLGIHCKQIKFTAVSSNLYLKRTDTLKILNKIRNALKNSKIPSLRNQIIHRSRYNDDKLLNISMYELVARNEKNKIQKAFYQAYASKCLKIYLADKNQEVKKSNKEMITSVEELFITLNEKYLEIKRFKE